MSGGPEARYGLGEVVPDGLGRPVMKPSWLPGDGSAPVLNLSLTALTRIGVEGALGAALADVATGAARSGADSVLTGMVRGVMVRASVLAESRESVWLTSVTSRDAAERFDLNCGGDACSSAGEESLT